MTDSLVRAVQRVVAEQPGRRFCAAALAHIYRETDGRITVPHLAVNCVEALAHLPPEEQAELRWSAADWDHYDDDWLGEDATRGWERALASEACRGTTRQWEATFRRYLAMLVRVCKRARRTLRMSGVTNRDFVVLLLDEEHHEALVTRILTKREVARHFPQFDEQAVELARVAGLSEPDRAAYFVSRLDALDGPVDGEEAEPELRALGPAAFPALLPLLAAPERAWRVAKLLADIGRPDEAVLRGLDAALTRHDGSDQAWVARALARLGRMDLVLNQVDRLPEDVVIGAVTAPYTSFRNSAVAPPPLDYRPLADVIARWPAFAPAVAEELKPGRGYCDITHDEVDEAVRGLTSPHVIIRRHAVGVLGERRLGAAVGRRVLPLLCQTVSQDPDAGTRRLAILSLLFWQKDSRPYAGPVRQALEDPAAEVREAATYWLREQGASGTAPSR